MDGKDVLIEPFAERKLLPSLGQVIAAEESLICPCQNAAFVVAGECEYLDRARQ